MSLQPQDLYWYSKSNNLEKALEYNLLDCIECGCCTYVCPSHIPLVQYYRYAKSESIAQERAQTAADQARVRNDNRLARIEREKQERAQRNALRTAKADTGDDADKQAAIQAAMERAKAQKEAMAANNELPKNTDNLSPAVQAEISEIDALRGDAQTTETNN